MNNLIRIYILIVKATSLVLAKTDSESALDDVLNTLERDKPANIKVPGFSKMGPFAISQNLPGLADRHAAHMNKNPTADFVDADLSGLLVVVTVKDEAAVTKTAELNRSNVVRACWDQAPISLATRFSDSKKSIKYSKANPQTPAAAGGTSIGLGAQRIVDVMYSDEVLKRLQQSESYVIGVDVSKVKYEDLPEEYLQIVAKISSH